MTNEFPESAGGLRASHDDRDAVVEQLRDAAAEGRLDADELDARLDRALTAKTHAELVPLTTDLTPVVPQEARKPLVLKGGIHGTGRVGRWQVPARITAHGGMAGVKLDFTQTESRLRVVEVEVHGEMAGVKIIIPAGWAADIDGVDPGMGGVKDKTTDERLPNTPLIRLTGSGGMAGVVIRHPNFWERWRLRRKKARSH